MEQLLRKVRVALTPRNRLLKTKLANGVTVYGRNRKGYGGRGIYIYRDALEPELLELERFLQPGATFLDIGANVGVFSLKAAKILEPAGGLVIALEPFPDMLAMLYHNVQTNGFNNIRLRNCCAGEETKALQFWMNFNRPHAFSLHKTDPAAKSFSTLVVAIDDLVKWESLQRLDYIKIDAEGAEASILKGAQAAITRFRPIVQAEVNKNEVQILFPQYSAFQASNSPNRVFIPNESQAIKIAENIGWARVHGM